MTDRSGPTNWTPSPPLSSGHELNGSALQLGLMLGEVRAISLTSLGRLDQIDRRLAEGQQTMHDHTTRIRALEQRPAPPPPKYDEVPRWERLLKRWLGYLLPLAVLWSTGSVEGAVKLLGALK